MIKEQQALLAASPAMLTATATTVIGLLVNFATIAVLIGTYIHMRRLEVKSSNAYKDCYRQYCGVYKRKPHLILKDVERTMSRVAGGDSMT